MRVPATIKDPTLSPRSEMRHITFPVENSRQTKSFGPAMYTLPSKRKGNHRPEWHDSYGWIDSCFRRFSLSDPFSIGTGHIRADNRLKETTYFHERWGWRHWSDSWFPMEQSPEFFHFVSLE